MNSSSVGEAANVCGPGSGYPTLGGNGLVASDGDSVMVVMPETDVTAKIVLGEVLPTMPFWI